MDDKEYGKMLDEVYANLPKTKGSGERFECPVAESFVQGNKTIIKNFDFVCQTLRRDPRDLAKYLFKELAVPGTIGGGKQLVLQGRFYNKAINERIVSYCKERVLCDECGKPDTHVEAVERNVQLIVCEACGARKPVRT